MRKFQKGHLCKYKKIFMFWKLKYNYLDPDPATQINADPYTKILLVNDGFFFRLEQNGDKRGGGWLVKVVGSGSTVLSTLVNNPVRYMWNPWIPLVTIIYFCPIYAVFWQVSDISFGTGPIPRKVGNVIPNREREARLPSYLVFITGYQSGPPSQSFSFLVKCILRMLNWSECRWTRRETFASSPEWRLLTLPSSIGRWPKLKIFYNHLQIL